MSMKSQKNLLRETAWDEIEICCTTLCNKDSVMDYIRFLEDENKRLREMIDDKE